MVSELYTRQTSLTQVIVFCLLLPEIAGAILLVHAFTILQGLSSGFQYIVFAVLYCKSMESPTLIPKKMKNIYTPT
jgi:hypothetical protein